MNDFQVTVPFIWSAVIQSLTFESAQEKLNRRYRILRGSSIRAVGYSADFPISAVLLLEMTICAVGYTASFKSLH
jgi:hypothetical protein